MSIVDDAALLAALADGRVAMAGLDTLDGEPVSKTHVLLTQSPELEEKLLFSPHIGGITGSSFRISYRMIWDNVRRLAAGEPLQHVVNHPSR